MTPDFLDYQVRYDKDGILREKGEEVCSSSYFCLTNPHVHLFPGTARERLRDDKQTD